MAGCEPTIIFISRLNPLRHPPSTMASSSLSLVSHGSADAGPSRPRQPLVAHTVPKEMSTESLRGWVRGLVDKPKHAIFQVKMTIEELQQVPQMQGEFMTEWQINGRRPHGKDARESVAGES